MKLLPVLDLMDGLVVRGIAGRRDEYRPVQSRLTLSTDPLSVARAFRTHYSLSELYLADLDAIVRDRPSWDVYRELSRDGFEVTVDAGLRDAARAAELLSCGAAAVVAGLETLPGPALLAELCERFAPARLVFSLDLKSGRALGDCSDWRSADPFDIACQAAEAGIRRMIVLDLADVGTAGGVGTLELCRRLAADLPGVELIAGGGVRGRADLGLLAESGVSYALVASALHDGRILPEDVPSRAESHGEKG